MRISSTTTTRFVAMQQPARKVLTSASKPLVDVQPDQPKAMAVAEPRRFVASQHQHATPTQPVLNERAANSDRPTIVSAPERAHKAYMTTARFTQAA